MNGLFQIKDSLSNKISYYHMLCLMASLPFDMFYSHIILISFASHTLIHLKKGLIKPVFNLRTIVLQSVFFITVFSTIYSINRGEAFNEWGKQITILLFPLLFCLSPLDIKKYRPKLLMAFALVCTATIAYLYIDAFITIRHYKLPFISTLFSAAFTNHNFSEPIGMHATFFSIQVAIALAYILSALIKEISVYRKLFYSLCCCILSAGLIQLCSKSVFVVMLLVINIALPYFLLQGRKRWRVALVSASFSILIVTGILNSATFKARYINGLKEDLVQQAAGETTDSRVARWTVAMELIGKSPLIGYGAGTEIGLLHDGFFNKKLYSSYLNRLNSHSQYLSFLLKSGVVGLLIYLGTLAFGLKRAFRQKDVVFFTFMLLVAIVSLSENLLDVDKGIFFYSFFFSFFIFSNERPRQNLQRRKTFSRPYPKEIKVSNRYQLEV